MTCKKNYNQNHLVWGEIFEQKKMVEESCTNNKDKPSGSFVRSKQELCNSRKRNSNYLFVIVGSQQLKKKKRNTKKVICYCRS